MSQFIAILHEQIPQVAPSQSRYRVTEIPTERTIRFYTSNNLVDKPLARDGIHAMYGYRHLLQILAIKYLQSQYLPLVKIRSLVKNISNRDLELLIPDITPVTAAHRGIAREDRSVVDNYLYQHVVSYPAASISLPKQPVENALVEAADTWRRVEIGPGIELHVHAAALTAENIERLRGALLRELGVLRGWFEEQKK